MNRIEHINKIATYSARFVLEVEAFNAAGLFDVNIHAESFLIPVLNEVFGLRLENLNSVQKRNFPAIDLADFNNRVAFQITATSSLAKIKDTIETFFRYNLDKHFDVLYIYIITQKKESYNEDKIRALLKNSFQFTSIDHVIDKDDLVQKISGISSTPKLENLAKLFQHEFSEVQLEMRKHKFESGFLKSEPENITPNLLKVSFPDTLYKAELNIDEAGITARINESLVKYGKKPFKKIRTGKLVKRALKEMDAKAFDWLLHEKCIYTFRDLHNSSEPFRQIIDVGTITPIECKEFYEVNEDYQKVFKNLLKNTLMELCDTRGIEWFHKRELFRFANNQQNPTHKQVRWKGKKESTKTVIFKMINKKEGHIICFRNLAFRCSFINLSDDWYLVVNPTWSFTNPGGYRQSRFESAYMAGIKRLENNSAVYNYFRFFGYYLSYSDLFTTNFPYLKIEPASVLELSPSLDEKKWRPVKVVEKSIDAPPTDIELDNELTDPTLFE